MWIDPRLRRQARNANTEELSFRVSAPTDHSEIPALVQAAIADTVRLWAAGAAVMTRWGQPAPPPEMLASSVPPDVYVWMGKFTEVTTSFEWLVRQLALRLPKDARLTALDRLVVPGSNREPLAAMELRIALEATRPGYDWKATPEVEAFTDAAALDWLAEVGPYAAIYLLTTSGASVRLRRGDELTAVRAQRDTDLGATLFSVFGTKFRLTKHWFPTAQLSLVIGDSDRAAFQWQAALDALVERMRILEPHAHMAFIHNTDTLAATGVVAHDRRRLWELPISRHMNDLREREVEECGLVDAQGCTFLPAIPEGVDHGWRQQPFGHLTMLTAPNLGDWLAQPPGEATVAAGRQVLAPLLYDEV